MSKKNHKRHFVNVASTTDDESEFDYAFVDEADRADESYQEYNSPEGGESFYGGEDQAARLVGSRGRAIALGGSLAVLLVVFSVLIWLLTTRASTVSTLQAVSVSNGNTASLDQAPRVGALAPDFELRDVHTNQPLKLSSLRGKPVFMNFWGTWCPPCRAEMPEMQKLHNKYGDQIQILGVTMGPRDEPAGVKAFVDAAKYDWIFIHDTNYDVATTYQVQAIPSSYFIDKDGVVRAVQVGGMDEKRMEAYLTQVR